MASPLTHIAVGYVLFRIANQYFTELTGTVKRLILICGALGAATVVDMDFVLGMLHHDLAGYHNQQSHSLCAAVVVGIGVGVLGRLLTGHRMRRWLTLGLVATLSHILIDFLTIGRGVQLLWPLTEARFTSPIPLFYGLRWSEGVWSSSHLLTLANEGPIIAALLWLTQQKLSRHAVEHIGEG
ncbi:MAG: metal-dependent hydrolase [Kiritimatiellia bacterium]|jgi:inner membrane protein|nr:metal-dependent hydrolase [Kiritimatiellia bacterium]MDP6811426.1 metal-dependent hydrolase [Kiritimatiellia bacterium]MDP7023338.1 metal-dependent hydrolase [Kiritimatiellia bacterium]